MRRWHGGAPTQRLLPSGLGGPCRPAAALVRRLPCQPLPPQNLLQVLKHVLLRPCRLQQWQHHQQRVERRGEEQSAVWCVCVRGVAWRWCGGRLRQRRWAGQLGHVQWGSLGELCWLRGPQPARFTAHPHPPGSTRSPTNQLLYCCFHHCTSCRQPPASRKAAGWPAAGGAGRRLRGGCKRAGGSAGGSVEQCPSGKLHLCGGLAV